MPLSRKNQHVAHECRIHSTYVPYRRYRGNYGAHNKDDDRDGDDEDDDYDDDYGDGIRDCDGDDDDYGGGDA